MPIPLQHFRQALRALRGRPGFAAAAMLTLALGLAGALALATVVHGVILRPLPYPEARRLVAVTVRLGDGQRLDVLSPTDVPDLEAGSALCQGIHLFSGARSREVESDGRFGLARVVDLDGRLLPCLGARPLLGRLFQEGDGQEGVVLSFEGWKRCFGEDRNLVGRRVLVEGQARRVLGVTDKGVRLPGNALGAEVFRILDRQDGNRGGFNLQGIARLRPGVSLASFQADLAARSRALEKAYPETNQGVLYQAEDLQKHLLGDRATGLILALGLAAFLLFIACVNVANLFLARGLERRGELAIRCALGAGRGDLMRQHLAEGWVIGLPAALLGLGGAWLSMRLLPVLLPDLPDLAGLRPQGGEVLLALLLVFAASLAFAVLPLRWVQDRQLLEALRSGTRNTTPSDRRTRNALVMAESALTVVMLTLGGLFLASFLKALHRDPGYRLREGVVFNLDLPPRRYPDAGARALLHGELKRRLEGLPGVRGVMLSSGLPNGHGSEVTTVAQAIPNALPRKEWPRLGMTGCGPGYFRQMGIPLLSGRDFLAQDGWSGPRVAILSARAARQFFPGRSPLGQRLQTGMGDIRLQDGLDFTVVGVCGDVVRGDLRGSELPQCYYVLDQVTRSFMEVALVTELRPEALRGTLEAQVKGLDPRLSIQKLTSLKALELEGLSDLRQATWLLGLFGGLGVLLGGFGVASVVATQVAWSTREIGLRMALGASPRRVVEPFVGRAMLHVGAGILVGLLAALPAGQWLASRLYQTEPADPRILAASALFFAGVAAVASFIPAFRAARVAPGEALRGE